MCRREPLRVLQCVNIMNRAGLENMLMNYYRAMDREVIQFDFLTHRADRGAFDDEIEHLGGRIYHMPRLYPQNYPCYFRRMGEFFQDHPYRIVHSHIDSMSYFPLSAAKRAGVENRIAHSHNSSVELNLKFPIKELARFGLRRVANWYFACGEEAGEYLFGKRLWSSNAARVIKNAVDSDKFTYDDEVRRSVREEYGFGRDTLVVGHVGRFEKVKNHRFLIDVFSRVCSMNADSRLLLVGDGPLRKEIEDQVWSAGLEGRVTFAGLRSDVDRLMNGMDVFMLPSQFEGLPVTVVEARCSGLPVLLSGCLPSDVVQLEGVESMSLKASTDMWARRVIELAAVANRSDAEKKFLSKSGYGIKENCEILQSIYLRMIA